MRSVLLSVLLLVVCVLLIIRPVSSDDVRARRPTLAEINGVRPRTSAASTKGRAAISRSEREWCARRRSRTKTATKIRLYSVDAGHAEGAARTVERYDRPQCRGGNDTKQTRAERIGRRRANQTANGAGRSADWIRSSTAVRRHQPTMRQ